MTLVGSGVGEPTPSVIIEYVFNHPARELARMHAAIEVYYFLAKMFSE